MGTITKDSVPPETPAAGALPSVPDRRANMRGDAVGAEIPVVVHASRFSTGRPGVARQLAPVHEETHTVIVFPQGAVVRLSANLLPGEVVVLTQKGNGHDVICRVESVKAQPGIQNYVSLEFTQRAPGFWGDLFPEERTAGAQLADPHPDSPAASTSAEPSEKISPPQFSGSALAQGTQPADSAVNPPNRTAPLSPPAKPTAIPHAATPVAALNKSGAEAKPCQTLEAQKPVRAFTPQLQTSEPASGSKKTLLLAAAAVILVAATLGGMALRREQGQAPQPSPQANLPQNPAPTEASVPQPATPGSGLTANSAPGDTAAAPPAPETTVPAAAPAETRPETKPPRPTEAARRRLSRPPIAIASLPTPIPNRHLASASSQPPAVPVASSDGNPLAAVQVSNGPARPAPVQGGQIQMPEPMESPAPTYPALARAESVQGTVVIDALVETTGRVVAMKVLSGPSLLRRAAMDALRTWRYQPGRLNGQPIAMHTQVHIDFRLK